MQTVLLTGAASGIGRQAALQFAAAGWRVLAVDRDQERLGTLRDELTAVNFQPIHLDLSSSEAITTLKRLDFPLDAIVNNAGLSDTSGTALVDQSPEQFERLFALNLDAPARILKALRDRLVPGARIVNVSSGAGLKAIPFRGVYSPTKAGLIAQSAALAKAMPELTVTCLCPGFVRTELVDSLISAGRLDPEQAVAKIPLGRMAAPSELARVIVFLAGRDARPLGGQTFIYDGGSSAYGGSARIAPSHRTVINHDAGTRYTLIGAPEEWADALPVGSGIYAAVLDFTPLEAPEGQLPQAVHQAAVRFAKEHSSDAALTLVLPSRSSEAGNWELASDVAAAEMLVRTLACELASNGLRVNALRMSGGPHGRAALVAFVAGVETQFLTGQILTA